MDERPVALVTGGGRRLGRIFALTLARLGYDLVLQYHRSVDGAAQTGAEAEALGVRVELAQADLTDPAQVEGLLFSMEKLPAPWKVLVNSAARMPRGDVRSLAVEAWDAVFALNLRAPFLLSQGAAGRMKSGGLIVNISDAGAGKAWSAYPAYIVSKSALESLTRLLARALAPQIRVNALAPGLALPSEDVPPEVWERLIARTPLQRAAKSGELASALEFLVKNEYITGQTILVDGGFYLT